MSGQVAAVTDLPSAVECGMDFARCQSCACIRWITPNALAEYGLHCHNCGSSVLRDALRVKVWERPIVFRWFMWEMGQLNGKGWWRDPVVLVQALWMAANPKIDYYDRSTAPPGEEQDVEG